MGKFIVSSIIVAALLAISCATPQASKSDKLAAKMSNNQKKTLDELRDEITIGRNMAGRLLAFYGVEDDEVLTGYLNQVGLYVAGFGDHPERRYMFQILDSETVNAFAAPGGYILVTRGAVRHAVNEAELAHVLGHEVAHVGLKHMFDSLQGMSKDDLEKAAKEADQAAFSMSPELKARKRPDVTDDSGALLARYLSGSSAGINVLSAAKAGMSLIMEKGLGAEKEFEADAEGTKYAVRAGYHPKALMTYLCRLEDQKNGGKNTNKKECRIKPSKKPTVKTILDKTHPSAIQRITHIKKTLAKMDSLEAPGALGQGRFMNYHKRMDPPKS